MGSGNILCMMYVKIIFPLLKSLMKQEPIALYDGESFSFLFHRHPTWK